MLTINYANRNALTQKALSATIPISLYPFLDAERHQIPPILPAQRIGKKTVQTATQTPKRRVNFDTGRAACVPAALIFLTLLLR